MPDRDELLVSESTITGIGQLADSLGDVTEHFFLWKSERSKFQIQQYQENFDSLTQALDRTCNDFQKTARIAEAESHQGVIVSQWAVDVIQLLLDPDASNEEIEDAMKALLAKVHTLMEAAGHLKESFSDIRRDFFWSKEQEASLAANVMDYGDARVSWGEKFWAAVVPPINTRTKAFREAADTKKRANSAQVALNLLKKTRDGIDRAIEITSKLVDDWSTLSTEVECILSHGLHQSKRAELRLSRRQWSGISAQYALCERKARIARERLQIKDVPRGPPQLLHTDDLENRISQSTLCQSPLSETFGLG